MKFYSRTKGFTLIELLVVISIISLLSSIVLASLSSAKNKANDTKRLASMKQIQTALELYRNQFGEYPNSDSLGCGGWDTPGNGTFLTALVDNKFLGAHVLDPTTNNDCGNYAYYKYSATYAGCPRAFYVLGIRDLETVSGTAPGSPGWSCTERNWQAEFEWVVGSYE